MKLKKIIASLKYILIFLFFLSIRHNASAAIVANKSLDIVLDQTSVTTPSIISVTVRNGKPNAYLVVLANNFIIVKEEDIAGTVLYEGQVKYTENTFESNSPPQVDPFGTEVPANPLEINFPYFDEARHVQIFAEDGTTLLLDIDLGLYGIGATPTAAPRFAGCNACGYCTGMKPPGNLKECMKCLYPDFVDNPDGSLAVDPIKNQPVQPKTGKQFTQLGCIDVGAAGFTDPGAAGGVLNIILNRLLFPITGVLSILALIYGSFLVMTAQDEAEQIARGKKWIYGAIIGVVFSFGAILLIRIIGGDILKIPGLNL